MSNRTCSAALVAATLLIVSSCERIGGRSIAVEFRNADGIRGGEAVYLAGVRIGTTGAPDLQNGRAHIPVTLARKHKDALPAGTVFLMKADPQDARKSCLAATLCSGFKPGQHSPDVYRGATNRLEFFGLCAAEKTGELFEELTK